MENLRTLYDNVTWIFGNNIVKNFMEYYMVILYGFLTTISLGIDYLIFAHIVVMSMSSDFG